jgi:hypothetical protein
MTARSAPPGGVAQRHERGERIFFFSLVLVMLHVQHTRVYQIIFMYLTI